MEQNFEQTPSLTTNTEKVPVTELEKLANELKNLEGLLSALKKMQEESQNATADQKVRWERDIREILQNITKLQARKLELLDQKFASNAPDSPREGNDGVIDTFSFAVENEHGGAVKKMERRAGGF